MGYASLTEIREYVKEAKQERTLEVIQAEYKVKQAEHQAKMTAAIDAYVAELLKGF